MKTKCILILLVLAACNSKQKDILELNYMSFTETDILKRLDLTHSGIPADDYPNAREQDVNYAFFLDLEHGYCETAGSKIHLYRDKKRWAIVFEKSGYQNRGDRSEITLDYVGNCINYPIDQFEDRNYISNSASISLITSEEYERIRNKAGSDMETFELISPDATEIEIHGQKVPIEKDLKKYLDLGIKPREYDNPNKLIAYGDIVRYFSDVNPSLVAATESEIKMHIRNDIPKLMTIDKFHFISKYDEKTPPSKQETFQLIAKVLITGDTTIWKPKQKPNNHWSNWESGHL